MKKFWLSLTVLIMLSACKSVTFNDLNVQMPNANLLPPLNTEVDREVSATVLTFSIRGVLPVRAIRMPAAGAEALTALISCASATGGCAT